VHCKVVPMQPRGTDHSNSVISIMNLLHQLPGRLVQKLAMLMSKLASDTLKGAVDFKRSRVVCYGASQAL
jgi:hypothetical protein